VAAWMLADSAGLVAHVERLMVDLGFETFEFKPAQLLRAALVVAALAVVIGTLVAVLTATIFNIVSRITGGLELFCRGRGPDRRRGVPT
jgi:Transmembrane domain of unknown function (DUF3566)